MPTAPATARDAGTLVAPATRRWLLGWAGGALVGGTATAACGPLGGQREGGAPADGAPVKLTYLHQWSQTQGHGPITDQLAARFREQFPAIQVEPVYSSEYYAKITAMIAGGDLPDVVTYNLAFLPRLVGQNVVVPAETLAKGAVRLDKNELLPAARDLASFNGQLVAVPYVLNTSGLAYNQTLFKQRGLDPATPPATWSDLTDMAKRLTGQNGDTPIWGTVFPKGTADSISPLVAFLWQNGGELVDTTKRVATWHSPAGVEALQFQVDLVHKHRVADYDKPGSAQAGEVGIWHLPPGNISQLQKNVGESFEWNTAHLPKGKQAATTVGGHSLSVLKTNRHHEQAWRFIHWWVQPAQNAEYLVASTTLPPWRAVESQPAWQRWLKEQPRFKPFVEMLAYGRPTPKLTMWEDVVNILAQARDAAGTGKKTAKEALDDAARMAEPLIQQG